MLLTIFYFTYKIRQQTYRFTSSTNERIRISVFIISFFSQPSGVVCFLAYSKDFWRERKTCCQFDMLSRASSQQRVARRPNLKSSDSRVRCLFSTSCRLRDQYIAIEVRSQPQAQTNLPYFFNCQAFRWWRPAFYTSLSTPFYSRSMYFLALSVSPV